MFVLSPSSHARDARKRKIRVEKIRHIAVKKNWQRFPNAVEFSDDDSEVDYELGISRFAVCGVR